MLPEKVQFICIIEQWDVHIRIKIEIYFKVFIPIYDILKYKTRLKYALNFNLEDKYSVSWMLQRKNEKMRIKRDTFQEKTDIYEKT